MYKLFLGVILCPHARGQLSGRIVWINRPSSPWRPLLRCSWFCLAFCIFPFPSEIWFWHIWFFKIVYCVCVCACACTWPGTGVEVRGQLAGVSYLLPPWLLGIKLTLASLTANTFTCWAILPALSPLNFKPNPEWVSTGSPRSADCIIILPLFLKVFPSPWQWRAFYMLLLSSKIRTSLSTSSVPLYHGFC